MTKQHQSIVRAIVFNNWQSLPRKHLLLGEGSDPNYRATAC